MRRLGIVLLGVMLLSGCAGGAFRSGDAERPAADQPATTEARKIARAHVELGVAYLEINRLGTAMEEARLAVLVDPAYAPAHQLLAEVYARLDEKPQALASFEKALSLAPGDPDLSNTFGWFLCSTGREKEGLEWLAKSAANPFNTTLSQPYTNSGLCQLRLKNDTAAAASFARALAIDGNNATAAFNLAAIAYRKGDLIQARALITELIRSEKPTADAVWLGIRVEHKLGNKEAEASYIAQLRKGFESSQQYLDYQAGRFE